MDKERKARRERKLMTNLDLLKQEFSDVRNEGMLKYIIPVLEDFEERIKKLELLQIIPLLPNRIS